MGGIVYRAPIYNDAARIERARSEREASEKRGASAVLSASEIGAARYETGAGGSSVSVEEQDDTYKGGIKGGHGTSLKKWGIVLSK